VESVVTDWVMLLTPMVTVDSQQGLDRHLDLARLELADNVSGRYVDLALCHLRMEPNKPRLTSASQLRAVCRRVVAQRGLLGVTASVFE
jgi:hypothetical protein